MLVLGESGIFFGNTFLAGFSMRKRGFRGLRWPSTSSQIVLYGVNFLFFFAELCDIFLDKIHRRSRNLSLLHDRLLFFAMFSTEYLLPFLLHFTSFTFVKLEFQIWCFFLRFFFFIKPICILDLLLGLITFHKSVCILLVILKIVIEDFAAFLRLIQHFLQVWLWGIWGHRSFTLVSF